MADDTIANKAAAGMSIEEAIANGLAILAAGAAGIATGVQIAEWREARRARHLVAGVVCVLWSALLIATAVQGAVNGGAQPVNPYHGRVLLIALFGAVAALSWPWGTDTK